MIYSIQIRANNAYKYLNNFMSPYIQPRKLFKVALVAIAAISLANYIQSQGESSLGKIVCGIGKTENGITRDYNFFEERAILGDAESQYCLGKMFLEGKGVNQSTEEAIKWFIASLKTDPLAARIAKTELCQPWMYPKAPDLLEYYYLCCDPCPPSYKCIPDENCPWNAHQGKVFVDDGSGTMMRELDDQLPEANRENRLWKKLK